MDGQYLANPRECKGLILEEDEYARQIDEEGTTFNDNRRP
jgi:hypothetical protein